MTINLACTLWASVNDPSPAIRYYRSLVGHWEGAFRLRVTSPAELARRSLPTQLTGWAAHLFGAMWMRTTLEETGPSTFRHTTDVRAWGFPVMKTEETMAIGDDGRSFRMRGTQRGAFGPATAYDAPGEIDEAALSARYELTWLGAPLLQRTLIVGGALELVQETAWSRAEVMLRRAA